MPCPFVSKKEEKIVLFLGNGDNNKLYCDLSIEKLKEIYNDVKEDTIEKHEIYFKRPSHKDGNIILQSGLTFEKKGENNINFADFKYTRMVTLITKWTFKDEKGVNIPVNEESISKLEPIVGIFIDLEMDRILKL